MSSESFSFTYLCNNCSNDLCYSKRIVFRSKTVVGICTNQTHHSAYIIQEMKQCNNAVFIAEIPIGFLGEGMFKRTANDILIAFSSMGQE